MTVRHPAFQRLDKRRHTTGDIYVPESTSLTTSDQRRIQRLGITKPEATRLLRDGVRGPTAEPKQ